MAVKTILVTGGARSGKSSYAQGLALKSEPPVLYVATAEAGDEEMSRRISDHRRSRPETWRTLEATRAVGPQISQHIDDAQTVVIDCITLLVSNLLLRHGGDGETVDANRVTGAVLGEIEQLIDCLRQTPARFYIVTNEVGLGLVPPNRLGRLYRDLLGRANQALAEHADEVYLMVSGLPLRVKPGGQL
ncbi:MAG: bifunctional adenosylcobinamide kinase/adenosylcobinamide-phosphate guanylyltransferase [Chloroflexota bacterium]